MTRAQLTARYLPVARTLWGGLTVSNVILGVVSFVVPPSERALDPGVVRVLCVFALGAAVGSFVLPRYLVASNMRRSQVLPGGVGRDGKPLPARFADPVAASRQAMSRGQVPFILSMALSETVSLFGFMLHMTGAPMSISTGLIAVGTLLAASRFPTPGRLLGSYERAHEASFEAEG